MKRALVILDDKLQAKGYKNSWHVPLDQVDYEFMANVHDEWQLAVKPEIAEEVGKACVKAITEAGLYYDFKCPLTGEYKIGKNWKDCH